MFQQGMLIFVYDMWVFLVGLQENLIKLGNFYRFFFYEYIWGDVGYVWGCCLLFSFFLRLKNYYLKVKFKVWY